MFTYSKHIYYIFDKLDGLLAVATLRIDDMKYFEQYTFRKERINYLYRYTSFFFIHANTFVKKRGIGTISQIFSHCLTIKHNEKMSIHLHLFIIINGLSLLLSY